MSTCIPHEKQLHDLNRVEWIEMCQLRFRHCVHALLTFVLRSRGALTNVDISEFGLFCLGIAILFSSPVWTCPSRRLAILVGFEDVAGDLRAGGRSLRLPGVDAEMPLTFTFHNGWNI